MTHVTIRVQLTASSSPKATGRVVTPNLPRPDSVFKSIASENAGNRGLVRAIFGRSSLSSRIELLAFALSLEGTFELQGMIMRIYPYESVILIPIIILLIYNGGSDQHLVE